MYEPKPVTHSRAMFHDLKTAVPSCTANSKEHAVAKAKPHARHRHVPAPHTAKPLLPVAEGQEVAVEEQEVDVLIDAKGVEMVLVSHKREGSTDRHDELLDILHDALL